LSFVPCPPEKLQITKDWTRDKGQEDKGPIKIGHIGKKYVFLRSEKNSVQNLTTDQMAIYTFSKQLAAGGEKFEFLGGSKIVQYTHFWDSLPQAKKNLFLGGAKWCNIYTFFTPLSFLLSFVLCPIFFVLCPLSDFSLSDPLSSDLWCRWGGYFATLKKYPNWKSSI
jgi:hypothetical protein